MASDKIDRYPGEEVDVTWDGRLCIHVGECGHAKGELFVGGRQPWCQPDLVSLEEAVDVVERCPSGALAYERKDGEVERPPAENSVTVSNRGPLYFHGELAIEGAPEDAPGLSTRAALCRCGKSASKPFCDNSHEESGFEDRGSIGETGPGCEAPGGTLTVKRAPDGPLLLSGNVTLYASSGRAAWRGTKAALCRCGASKNKPFCDGTHKHVGFQAP